MRIYKITNRISNKVYIGQTKHTTQERFRQHCCTPPALSAIAGAIQKYGKDNFTIEELALASTQDELDVLEKTHIKLNDSISPNGYNLKDGGLEGSVFSAESREKMSKAKRGRKISDETKEKMSRSHKISLQNESLRKYRGERLKERYASDPSLSERMSTIRKEYWSHPEHKEVASARATAAMNDEQKALIGQKVKEALSTEEVQEKMLRVYAKQRRPVLRSDGAVFSSVKEAAAASNTRGSSIIKQIKGRYKSAGGFTFKYLDTEE